MQNAQARLDRLAGFLAEDPDNLNLLADTARVAGEAGVPERIEALLARYERIAPLPADLANLRAVAAMGSGNHGRAVADLESLVQVDDDPALRFNLAWALAMTGDHDAADAQLDDAALAASPRAPALKIRMMHHQGLLAEAMALGSALAARFPGDGELCGALAILALDAGDAAAADDYAHRAGPSSGEGITALAMLHLLGGRQEQALRLFEEALALVPQSPRARLGRGLAQLAGGDSEAAAADLDKSATLFGSHLGSWIAAGWAHLAAGDRATARARFETALELDGNFSEVHGSLAILDLAEGKEGSARRRSETALRLDPESFSGALAHSLLLDAAGDGAAAEKVRAAVLSASVGGHSLAQALVGFGRKRPKD